MRKVTAMLIAGALTLGALVPTALANDKKGPKGEHRPRYELEFKDWQRDFWANESLARMITRGVIKGNGDFTIAPSRPVTRLEAAIMLSRLLELQPPQIPYGKFELKTPWGQIQIENEKGKFEIEIKSPEGHFKFKDSKDVPEWGRDAVLTALREGFLIFDGASLSPMKPLTRLEAAIMLVKAAGLDAEAKARAGADLEFKDEEKIPAHLRGYIAVAVENGFVNGYEDGTFRPERTLTRAEWAALLDRLDRRNGPDVTADGRQIKAVVTAVDAGSTPSISVITPVYPHGVTYQVDETAVFYKNGKEISIDEVQVDDSVIINLDGDREIILLTVNNLVRQVNGTVEAFTGPSANEKGSITVLEKGQKKTYIGTEQTKVLLNGWQGSFDDVRKGDLVTLKVEGVRVTQISIKVEPVMVTGTLEEIDFGSDDVLPSLTIKGEDGKSVTYSVADHATIKGANGADITLADLNVGDTVTLRVERDLIVAIQVKPAPIAVLKGKVEEYVSPTEDEDGSITIVENGKKMTFTVTDETEVLLGSKKASLDEVQEGDLVSLKVQGSRVLQIAIRVEPFTVTGILDEIDFGSDDVLPSLTVKVDDETVTYSIADHADIRSANGARITLDDLKEGDKVMLKVERNLVTFIQVKK